MTGDGLIFDPTFIPPAEREALVSWLETLHPLWEDRHTDGQKPRTGQRTRRLLRPVYWLGGWQFACLNYFHPPKFVVDRVVEAEPFPPVLQALARQIEARVSAHYAPEHVPDGWTLNTCLINFYGLTLKDGRWIDTARVGGHRDYEPGPVASLSLGAGARFQFASRPRGPIDEDIVAESWLPDRSLLVFGTPRWKEEVYHRVPLVRRNTGHHFDVAVEGFQVRRINLTLRYVPPEYIVPYRQIGESSRARIRRYVEALGLHAPFYAEALLSRGS